MEQHAPANGLTLCYETFGNPADPPLLLIMGLGAQMVLWDDDFCVQLAAQGLRVIRFDNRDCGRSSWMDGAPIPDIGAAMRHGTKLEVPYTLEDMAADSLALLDALSIRTAHIVGISMGGAIAQIIAAQQPERTLSLTCLMSSSGRPTLPGPTPEAAVALFAPLPRDRSRDSIVADGVRRYLAVASPSYPTEVARLQSMFEQEYERGFYPQGVARQLAAIIANGDRSALLGEIRVPTLVIHGADDPLIPAVCGDDIARQVSGAELLVIEGMGHDLPLVLTGQLVDAIVSVAGRQGADAGSQ